MNECKIVEYRGEKVAAFMINGKTMLCLPQAFELFLKVRLDTCTENEIGLQSYNLMGRKTELKWTAVLMDAPAMPVPFLWIIVKCLSAVLSTSWAASTPSTRS